MDVEYERDNSYSFSIENKKFRVSGAFKDSDPSILQCTVNNKTYHVRAVEHEGKIHLFTKVIFQKSSALIAISSEFLQVYITRIHPPPPIIMLYWEQAHNQCSLDLHLFGRCGDSVNFPKPVCQIAKY